MLMSLFYQPRLALRLFCISLQFASLYSRKSSPHHKRSCTTALACPRKVVPAGKKLSLAHWILISCIIWSMDQASLAPLCQILPRCTVIFLVSWSCLLDIKLYVNLWHKLVEGCYGRLFMSKLFATCWGMLF